MASIPDELEAAALALPREERARLVKTLIDSLDSDLEISMAWEKEVKLRLEAFRKGDLESYDAEDVIQSARAQIQK